MAETLERPLAPARHRLDAGAYYRMAEAGILAEPHRVELIDGDIIDMAAIGSPHAAITNRLIRAFAERVAEGSTLMSVQSPLRLDAYNEPQPDVMLLRPRADDYRESHPTAADVLLLAEVSETSLAYDRSVKAPALREIPCRGGLDRRSCGPRGRGLSRAEGRRLCVTRTARPGIAFAHRRRRRDGRRRRDPRLKSEAVPDASAPHAHKATQPFRRPRSRTRPRGSRGVCPGHRCIYPLKIANASAGNAAQPGRFPATRGARRP